MKIGALLILIAPIVSLSLESFHVLYAGRVLQGMSAGYMAVIMPMYLTETLPADIRGRGTGVFQFCLGLGLVVAAGAGCLVATWYGASDTADAAGRVAAYLVDPATVIDPLGTTETYRNIEYRVAPIDLDDFSNLGEGDRVSAMARMIARKKKAPKRRAGAGEAQAMLDLAVEDPSTVDVGDEDFDESLLDE